MKRLRQAIPVMGTLLLLVLGANMPRLASLVVDRRLEGEVIHREDTHASLEFMGETDFFRTLELFQSEHTWVKLSEGYHMTADEAKAQALDKLYTLGLSDVVYSPPEVTPMLITSKEFNNLSGVYWRCTSIEADNVQAILWLDDNTGELVSLQSRVQFTDVLQYSPEAYTEAANRIVLYCDKYYPVNEIRLIGDLEKEYSAQSAKILSENEKYSVYEFNTYFVVNLIRNKDGEEETLALPIYFIDNWLCFNA